ncbi:MAG: class I SAM-dependent methyltransferase [Trueperaceae bacterium]
MSDVPDIYDEPDLYDEQYLRYRDDIPFYQRLAVDVGEPVLELGAGSGRLSVELGRAGHRVVGVELSPRMLEQGRARVEAERLDERVRLLAGDMRKLRLEERFPLIVAAFNTLMHLYTPADQDAALATVATLLAPGGTFAFDLFLPEFGPQGLLRREAEWENVGGARSELFLVQEHDRVAQTITSRYYLDSSGADGLLRRRTTTLHQRYYTRFEIERALRQAGFSRISLSGDFDRRPVTADSPRLVGLARL